MAGNPKLQIGTDTLIMIVFPTPSLLSLPLTLTHTLHYVSLLVLPPCKLLRHNTDIYTPLPLHTQLHLGSTLVTLVTPIASSWADLHWVSGGGLDVLANSQFPTPSLLSLPLTLTHTLHYVFCVKSNVQKKKITEVR